MRIIVTNVKMINSLDLTLNSKVMTFIGEQASGKSTIAKIVFLAHFFPRLLSLYAINLMSFSQKVDPSLLGFQKEFERCIRERMPGVETGSIVFAYSNDTLKATAIFTKKEVKVDFNEALSKRINDYISTFAAGARNSKVLFEGGVFSVDDFEIDEDVCVPFYIPAGRGALLSISEQIQGSRMIPSQDEFALGYIRSSVAYKRIFKSNASTIQKWRSSSRPEKRRLFELLSIVLKGGYEQDSTGNEFLRVEGKNELVEVRNASSGQQEILYPILFLLDEIIHPRKRRLIIFEEPEAHLHPKSQKAIVELIAYVVNHSPSRFLITTHSPYILSAFNPLILSGQIEKKGSKNPIVYPEYRLDKDAVVAYSLTLDPSFAKRINCDDGTIDATDIDTASDVLNEQIYALMGKQSIRGDNDA